MERGGRAYIVGLTLAVNLGGVGRGTRAVVDVGDVCPVNLAVVWRGLIHDAMPRIVRSGVAGMYIVGLTLAVNPLAVNLGAVGLRVQFGY